MISFFLSLIALIVGYLIYGKIVEKMFGADETKETPAIRLEDGVDFVPMPAWKIFMIQFLNIAGLGPIFGAIAGALWDLPHFYGLFLALFLQVEYMIIFQVCCLYDMTVQVYQR